MVRAWAPAARAVAGLIAAALLATGCGSDGGGGAGIVDIQVEPQSVQLAKGTTAPLKATALYSNGAKEDITGIAEWTSADPSTAAIGTETQAGQLVLGADVGTTQVTASYSGFDAAATITVTPAVPTGLEISPDAVSQPKGTSRSLAAVATFSDGTSQDVTSDSSWTTSNAAIVAVSDSVGSKGRITAVEFGSATVTATFQSLVATSAVTVSSATLSRVEVEPMAQSIANGTQYQFSANALFSDGTTQDVTASATWSSSSAAIATVSDAAGSKGLAQGEGEGSAQISATYLNQTGAGTLTVTAALLTGVEISPINATIANGTTRQFTATAVFSDGSKQNVTTAATWASSNAAVATISNTAGSSGLAQSVDVGTTEISFTYNSFSATTNLTVSAAVIRSIEVTPANSSIAKGTQQQFAATAVFTDDTTQDITGEAAWTSTNTSVATVNNTGSKGLAAGVNNGSTSIRAAYQSVTGSTGLTVTAAVVTGLQVAPPDPSIAKGTTQQFTATALFSDGSQQNVTTSAQWTSGNPQVATISNATGSRGRADGLALGSAPIEATYQDQSASTTLRVTEAVLTALQIAPAGAAVPVGRTQQYKATGVFSDDSTQDLTTSVTWSSTAPATIDISNAAPNVGLAAARAVGTATIKAVKDGIEGSTGVSVTNAMLESIQVTPSSGTLGVDYQRYFTAMGTYSDGATRDITNEVSWTSADPSRATISVAAGSRGLATGVAVGSVTISASLSGISKGVQLTVNTATLSAITVQGPDRLLLGASAQYTARADFTVGDDFDVTRQVQWQTDAPDVATISDAAGSKGRATATSDEADADTVTFTATYDAPGAMPDVVGSKVVVVDVKQLTSIAIAPLTPSVPAGLQRQFTATGTFEDGSTGDITATVTWTSSNTGVAEFRDNEPEKGLLFAISEGTANVTATQDGKSATTTVTVTDALLESIAIMPADDSLPAPLSIPVNFAVQFKALGIYSDSPTPLDITDRVTWDSLQPATVEMRNASPDKGYAIAKAAGSATMRATLDGKQGTATVTAVATALSSIDVTPKNQTVDPGETVDYVAKGTFASGGVYDITREVNWTSTSQTTAQISNAEGSEGEASAQLPGTTTIRAASGNVNGSTTLTVDNPLFP